MSHIIHDIKLASQIGRYSDAVEIAPNQRLLFTSGTPGLSAAGEVPDDITAQSEIAWRHIIGILEKANMGVGDIFKVTQYLTRFDDVRPYAQVRNRYLGDARPASMLAVIPDLVWKNFLVEVEIMAAKPA
ncbi:MAG TPA: RidA family protein [Burkholderiales bacterium]|jgi:enamine deaminase RidA (YjgF/YER057c/UK114 family)